MPRGRGSGGRGRKGGPKTGGQWKEGLEGAEPIVPALKSSSRQPRTGTRLLVPYAELDGKQKPRMLTLPEYPTISSSFPTNVKTEMDDVDENGRSEVRSEAARSLETRAVRPPQTEGFGRVDKSSLRLAVLLSPKLVPKSPELAMSRRESLPPFPIKSEPPSGEESQAFTATNTHQQPPTPSHQQPTNCHGYGWGRPDLRTRGNRDIKTEPSLHSPTQQPLIVWYLRRQLSRLLLALSAFLHHLPLHPLLIHGEKSAVLAEERARLPGHTLPLDRCPLTNALPDYLQPGLDIVFIGINPGLRAGKIGRYYPGHGNHFWKCVYHSRLITKQLGPEDDYTLPNNWSIGFTEVVRRTTQVASQLNKAELRSGALELKERLLTNAPRIAVFNGKEIYRIFSGSKDFPFGLQPAPLSEEEVGKNISLFVLPSSSARCTQLPRYTDKLIYYEALRKYRDYLRGEIDRPLDSELVFNSNLPSPPRKIKLEPKEDMKEEARTLSTPPSQIMKRECDTSPDSELKAEERMSAEGLGLAASSSAGAFGSAAAEAMFSSSGNSGTGGLFHSTHNPLLSSTNTPSPDAGLHFPGTAVPSTSASTPPFASASPHHAPAAATQQTQPQGRVTLKGGAAGMPQPDPAVVEAHIIESVMAVVERCKSGTLEIPDHYIRPSDFPPPKQARPQPAPAPTSHHKAANHHHARPAHQQPMPAHHQAKAQPRKINTARQQQQQQQQAQAPNHAQAVTVALETFINAPYLTTGTSQQVYAAPAAMVLQQATGYTGQGNQARSGGGQQAAAGLPQEFYNAYFRQGAVIQQQPQHQPQQQQQQFQQQQTQQQQQQQQVYAGNVPYQFMYAAGGTNGAAGGSNTSNNQQNY